MRVDIDTTKELRRGGGQAHTGRRGGRKREAMRGAATALTRSQMRKKGKSTIEGRERESAREGTRARERDRESERVRREREREHLDDPNNAFKCGRHDPGLDGGEEARFCRGMRPRAQKRKRQHLEAWCGMWG